ncbi:MAG: hypothetical protein ACREDM_09305 [Methylocella sp.]
MKPEIEHRSKLRALVSLTWKQQTAGPVGRMTVTSKVDFKTEVHLSMLQLQNNQEKLLSFHQNPSLGAPLEYLVIYAPINMNGKKDVELDVHCASKPSDGRYRRPRRLT